MEAVVDSRTGMDTHGLVVCVGESVPQQDELQPEAGEVWGCDSEEVQSLS